MKQIIVPVISKTGKPLIPCSSAIARLLLMCGKAKIKYKEPFVIQLTYNTKENTIPHTLAVDTGSGTIGFAVINNKNEVVYVSEVILRNDIKDKMDRRRLFRHNRRYRKTRYRKPRYSNRKHSKRKGLLYPTLLSKIEAYKKEIRFLQSIFPIDNNHIVFEMGMFNIASLQNQSNPSNAKTTTPWGYQKGRSYGFENTRAKVKYRDHNTCQICHGKSKDKRLNVHHIVYKSNHGSDLEDNLITLCETCHHKLHAGLIKADLKGKKRGALSYATQMNTIRSQLSKIYPNAKTTWGYITAVNRKELGYNKISHWLDAVVIATGGKRPTFKTDQIYIKHRVTKGDYKQTRGKSSKTKLTRTKIHGFRKFDKVMYRNKLYFIKSCHKEGYFDLMNIYGKEVFFSYLPRGNKSPKYTKMRRICARSSQIIWTQKINDIMHFITT